MYVSLTYAIKMPVTSTFVDSVNALRTLVQSIEESPAYPPFLFVDLEGINLSRHGSISILQIFVPAIENVFIVDIHTLKGEAFETRSNTDMTLKVVLESSKIPKVFFDLRNDSDALFTHFQINLQCVVDIQLMEFVTRPYPGRYLRGLSKCIQEQAGLNWTQERQWQRVKDAGVKLFAPEKGGTYEIFNARPLPKAVLDYCIQDVMLLPTLLLNYARKLHKEQALDASLEALKRVKESQSPFYQSHGSHKTNGPIIQRGG